MHYFIVVLVIILLSFLTLREKRKRKVFSSENIKKIQNDVLQQLALNNSGKAEKLLQPLIKKRRGGSLTSLLQIKILRKNKKYKEAFRAVEDAIKKCSDDLNFHKEYAKVALKMGMAKESVKAFERCQGILDEDDVLDFVSALLKVDELELAWSFLKKLLKNSCSGEVLFLAGNCYFQKKNYERALYYYLKAKKWNYKSYQLCLRTGHSLRFLRRFKEAEDYFYEILEKVPSDTCASLGLGACLEGQKLYDQALDVYRSGAAWDTSSPVLLCRAGICAVYTHHYEFARDCLKEASRLGKKTPQVLAFLAYSLEALKEWLEAEKIYIYLVKTFPHHVAGYRGLAWLFGVGFSSKITASQGLSMARHSQKLHSDLAAWEILSACEARAGNFDRAHYIQECLAQQSKDRQAKHRRSLAMRTLRQKTPLDETQVSRSFVA